MVGSASNIIIHIQVINILQCQWRPLCPSFLDALIIMSDILHKVGDVSIILAPILAVYLLQSEFTLQVRSVLFPVLLNLTSISSHKTSGMESCSVLISSTGYSQCCTGGDW